MENTAGNDNSLKNKAWLGAWRSRSVSLWGLGAVGLAAGALVGLAAPLFPVLVGAYSLATAAGLMGTSAAIFGTTGMTTGVLVGGIVGSSSGAAGAVAEEQERREKARDAALGIDAAPSPEAVKPKTKLFNWKVAVTFGAIGIAAGLVCAAALAAGAFSLPAIGAVAAAAGGNAAAATTAYCVGVIGCFGAMFGINIPELATRANKVFEGLLTGKSIGASWDKETSVPQVHPQHAAENVVQTAISQSRETASCEHSKHFQEMLVRQQVENSSQSVVRS